VVPEFFVIPLNHPLLPQEIPLSFPFFVKPVKGVLSLFSRSVVSHADLERIVTGAQRDLPPFAKPFNDLLQETGLGEKFPLGGDHLIAEAILSGHQVTLEGYVFAGDIQLIDIVDSIFYPDTRSFERFQCPSALPQEIQDQMFEIAQQVIKNIGFDNCIFNFEFIHDFAKKQFYILEINSRIAHQFAGMMEAVHGTNTYEISVDIAAGQKPAFRRFHGNDRYAASYVLRTFEDLWVESTPTAQEVAAIQREFPKAHVENLIKPGRRLSDHFRQDTESYRYAIINLSAENEASLQNQFRQIKERLAYQFSRKFFR
jgi:biotin carboxylase